MVDGSAYCAVHRALCVVATVPWVPRVMLAAYARAWDDGDNGDSGSWTDGLEPWVAPY